MAMLMDRTRSLEADADLTARLESWGQRFAAVCIVPFDHVERWRLTAKCFNASLARMGLEGIIARARNST
ncbi:hypothetical protein AOG23_34060 [Rhizobium acidisoli]|nr:hypothetical protein AOG23_34060 [Rhizobium acidisoli]